MKIRFLDNSIRFRVSRNELEKLMQNDSITSATSFPAGVIKFKIECSGDGPEIRFHSSSTDYCEISLRCRKEMIHQLGDPDSTGFSQSFKLNDGSSLSILFEKDFKCLTPREEDESDLFPHPGESMEKC